jgi:peptidyl-prolyl cis-trans isomerase B (cyclophilin B)
MHRRTLIAGLAALALGSSLLAGCSGAPAGGSTSASTAATAPAQSAASAAPTASVAVVRVALTTSKGVVDLELYPDKAPGTVANFVKLVKSRFYDGILVHRVEPGFVVQAGDPLTRGMTAKRLKEILARLANNAPLAGDPQIGTGGPGWTIPLERNDLVHDRGVIAMARTQDPDSAGSQFYITLAPAHQLDGQYAVFGKVTAGMDVVDRLVVGDVITSAKVISE